MTRRETRPESHAATGPGTPCPCGRGTYEACCGRYHAGDLAPTAEALMRSRYSAYARGDVPYLRRSWHRTTRPRRLDADGPTWTGLEIVESAERDGEATVEFRAHYRVGAEPGVLHERSRFVREDGAWLYLDGERPDQTGS